MGLTSIQMVVEGVDGVHTMTFPALSVPDPSSNGRTMITPGRHPISC